MDQETVAGLASTAEIAEVAAAARTSGRLGIDTEFMSEGRYRALLCLVQVAIDDPGAEGGVRIILIDSLDRADVSPLADLLGDPAIEVVLHSGRQDVAILRRAWSTDVNNIFDTQLAAGFAGASAQAGYGNLLGAILGRSAADRGAAELRRRGRSTPAGADRRAATAAARDGPSGMGAGGVSTARVRDR
jgi:ribonuclease D